MVVHERYICLFAMVLLAGFFSSGSVSGYENLSDNTVIDFSQSNNHMSFVYYFDDPLVSENMGGLDIKIQGLQNSFVSGTASLPVKGVSVLVPKGYSVKDVVTSIGSYEIVANGDVIIVQDFEPIGFDGEIIESISEEPYSQWTLNDFRGYKILNFELNPVVLVGDEVRFHREIRIEVELERTELDYSFLRGNSIDKDAVASMVDNPSVIGSYASGGLGIMGAPLSEPAEYIIITNEYLENSTDEYNFTTLLNSKTNRTSRESITGKIVTVEDIYANSSFWCSGEWGDGCVEPINKSLYLSIPIHYNNNSVQEVFSGSNSLSYSSDGIGWLSSSVTSPYNNSWYNSSLIPLNLTTSTYSTPWLSQGVTYEYSVDNISFESFTPNVDSVNIRSVVDGVNETDLNIYIKINYSMENGGLLFNDSAAMIRNYLKYAYSELGTRWVLLGGDVDIIPARDLYLVFPTWGKTYVHNSESDVYYSNLNGSFNNNYNIYWGDNKEIDWYYELIVGRMPVETYEELSNVIRKTLYYEGIISNVSSPDAKYLRNSMYVQDPSVYFYKYPNDIMIKHSFKNIVKNWGVYDPDYPFIEYLNSDTQASSPYIINHAAHGAWYMVSGGFYSYMAHDNVANLTNKYPFFLTSSSCLPAKFSEIKNDSVYEKLLYAENGSFAILGNANYGWYGPVSYEFNDFWVEMFESTNQSIGEGFQDSKQDLITKTWAYDRSAYGWMYLTQVLLGDPELRLYLTPQEMDFYSLNVYSPVDGAYYDVSDVLVNLSLGDNESVVFGNNGSLDNNYLVAANHTFAEGVNILTMHGSNIVGEADDVNVTFVIDMTPPKVNLTNFTGSMKRFSEMELRAFFDETYCMTNATLEANVSGDMLSYTYVSANDTSIEFLLRENITTMENNFSYRFYLEDCAGNFNVTNWENVNVTNSLPVLKDNYENIIGMIFRNETINLSEAFSDVDRDNLIFNYVSSANVSYILNDSRLVVRAINSSLRSGNIILSVRDSVNVTNYTINFSFVIPSILSVSESPSSGFDGNTTVLNGDYENIPLVLEKEKYGKIEFNSANVTDGEISINNVNISQNRVFINSSSLPGLNTRATISLKLDVAVGQYCQSGLIGFPVIYKINSDGSSGICSDCSSISCASTRPFVYVFEVDGFSTYEIRAPTCSDGVRNQNEDGVDCGGVCHACTTIGSGGGSGGSGGSAVSREVLNLTEEDVEDVTLPPMGFFDFSFNNVVYRANVVSFNNNGVGIMIPGLLIGTIVIKDSEVIDLDGDNIYDIKISYLENISNSPKMRFEIYQEGILNEVAAVIPVTEELDLPKSVSILSVVVLLMIAIRRVAYLRKKKKSKAVKYI